jgi:hypothetical protein
MNGSESPGGGHWQFSLKSLFAGVTAIAVIVALNRWSHPDYHKPHDKALVHNVFYLGMSADEAISKLPPSYQLEPIAIYYDYGPNGPTRTQILNDECYGLSKPDFSENIPLFFSEARRLVKVGPTFDEEKFVSLYEQRTRKDPESGQDPKKAQNDSR